MQKTIFISGIISEFPFTDEGGNERDTYSVTNLVSAVKKAREESATAFAFHIDSDGGSIEEGFRMARYIESLPEPTTGIAQRVFSIANVVYFACDKRKTDKYANWMLHNAWLMNISGNSKELREYADDLERTSNRMANYISYRTGLEVSALKALMDTDRLINEDEAKDLGFLNAYRPIKAVAVSLPQAKTYSDYPESAVNNAKKALKWLEENDNPNDCLTHVGFARANQLANREPLSLETVKEMSKFARHKQHKDVPYEEGCGGIAWDAWGGSAGVDWAKSVVEKEEQTEQKSQNTIMAGIKEEFQKWAKSLGFAVTPLSLSMETEDGKMMEVETENEGELLGKSCNMEDGEYAMKDGKHITVIAGKIEKVQGMDDKSDMEDEEKEQMRAEIQNLQAQLQEAQARKREVEEKQETQSKEIDEVRKQMDHLAKMVQTSKSAPAPNKPFAQTRPAKTDDDVPEELKGMTRNQVMLAWQTGKVTTEQAQKAFLALS